MILLAAAAALMVLIFLVFTPDASTGQKENAHLIGASYMTMNNEFYDILNEQIRVRVEGEGDLMVLRDPGLDVERQVRETDASDTMEGLYIKIEENGQVIDRLKYVRASFTQTVDVSQTHWLDRPIVPNGLAIPVEAIYAPKLPNKE